MAAATAADLVADALPSNVSSDSDSDDLLLPNLLPSTAAMADVAAAAQAAASPFDLVVASDVVYYEALVDPLIETLRFFVKGEVVFVMAHMRRWKRTDKKFFGKARKVFDVEVVHEDPPLEGWRHGPVVYRFTAKKQHGKNKK